MPCRLAQQRMTMSDVEWPFHASRAISAVAELFVQLLRNYKCLKLTLGMDCTLACSLIGG